MPLTIFVHLPKEHLRLAFPGQLGKFVYGGDQQGWQEAIDLFINDQHGQAFRTGLFAAKSTLSVAIATVHQCAPTPFFIGFDVDVFAGCYHLTTPGTMRQLAWISIPHKASVLYAMILVDSTGTFFSTIGRRALSHPQPQAKWGRAPSLGIFSPDDFACADEGRYPLELL